MCKFSGITLACCAVAFLLDSSRSDHDRILTHMCSSEIGAKFWRDVLECCPLMQSQVLEVLRTCIPMASYEEAEKTRCSVCSKPDQWKKMMDCVNEQLIGLQDESNPYLELSPGIYYKTCVVLLLKEAELSKKDNRPFLPEDERVVDSSCENIVKASKSEI